MLILHDISEVAHAGRVRAVPGIECCLALWTASAPEREPLSAAASRLVERLPLRTRRAAARLDRRLPGWPLHAANWFAHVPASSVTQSLETLREESPVRLALDLVAGPLLGPDRDAGRRTEADKRRDKCVAAVLRRPEDNVVEILDVIEDFCAAGFARLWAQEHPQLARLVRMLETRVEEDLVRALLSLSSRTTHDVARDQLTFLGGQGCWSVSCSAVDRVDVMPSLWLRRRVVALYQEDRVAICLPALPTARDRLESSEVDSLLFALSEPRRLQILRLCTSQALCTQEIARQLAITEAPVSRHLKQLERHGLVVGQRFGRQVTYVAVPEMLAVLGDALREFGREIPMEPEVSLDAGASMTVDAPAA